MNNGHLTISLCCFLFFIIVVGVSPVHANPIETFGFDQHPYVIGNHGGLMYYNFDYAGNNQVDQLSATVSNSCYSSPIQVTLTERSNADDGWLYSDRITFVSSPSCPASTPPAPTGDFSMNVNVANPFDYVVAEMTSLTPTYLTDTVNIDALNTNPLMWSQKRTDNNWATCTDNDDDAICDSFENDSQFNLKVTYPSGSSSYTFNDPNCSYFTSKGHTCSDDTMKDLWVEMDVMQRYSINPDTIERLQNTFLKQNIRLHFIVDESIPYKQQLKPGGLNHPALFGTDQVKAYYFGTPQERSHPDWSDLQWKQKKQVFRYGLVIDQQKGAPTSSGFAEVLGNDFGLSYGGWPSDVKTHSDYQTGTILHELGHNLGLNHGGAYNDNTNCKPNHISVMNYAWQLPILYHVALDDFSNATMSTLDDSALLETSGIGTFPPEYTANGAVVIYGPVGNYERVFSGSQNDNQVDWNKNNQIDTSNVQVDTNYISSEGCFTQGYDVLVGYDDWDNIEFDVRGTGAWADGRLTSECKKLPANANPNACPPSPKNPNNNNLGQNVKSKYASGPDARSNWDERVWASGKDEITYEDAKSFHILNIINLNQTIQRLDDSAFIGDSVTAKNLFIKEIKLGFDAVDNDDYDAAVVEFGKIKNKIPERIHSEFAGKINLLADKNIVTKTGIGKGPIPPPVQTIQGDSPEIPLYASGMVISTVIAIVSVIVTFLVYGKLKKFQTAEK